MIKIIFLILFVFSYNLYQIPMPIGVEAYFFQKKSNNKYALVSSGIVYSLDLEYDNVVLVKEKKYGEYLKDFRIYQNNLIVYIYSRHTIIEYKGKSKEIYYNINTYDGCYEDHSFSNNSLLILTSNCIYSLDDVGNPSNYFNNQLFLIKEPYDEISKTITVETGDGESDADNDYFEIIGLKDCLVYIHFAVYDDYNGNVTYKIYDYNLNHINTQILKYENFYLAEHTEISENGKFNEFILCIHYIGEDQLQCQMIKYRNKTLLFSEKINIYYPPKNKFLINIFDENKIGIYFYNDGIKFILYKETYHINVQGLGVLTSDYFCYLETICVSKNITLSANELLNFPISKFIIQGYDSFNFSFQEKSENLIIYRDSKEIKVGEIFHDLYYINTFKYFLKIDTFLKDIILKVKNQDFDYICDINIEVSIDTNISTYKESQKCFKNTDYSEINNIIYSNLFDYFTVNNERNIKIELIMEKEPKGPELIFYVNDIPLNCINNSTRIICSIPVNILPRLTPVHLYSYLSCFNLIKVGWFVINDKDVFNIYNLINYDFDNISKIYDPSKNIIEYNPAMINYYYWFACLSFCDDEKIEKKECCSNILDKWEIVFHKIYSYEKGLLDFLIDLFTKLFNKLKKSESNSSQNPLPTPSSSHNPPPTPSSSRNPPSSPSSSHNTPTPSSRHNPPPSPSPIQNHNLVINLDDASEEEGDIDSSKVIKAIITAFNIIKRSLENGHIDIKYNINAKTLIYQFIYLYNFVILKNDEYKKIVVTFPGSTNYLQIIDEFIFIQMKDLHMDEGKKYFYVLEEYYNIFNKIENDLFNNLKSLAGINDPEYQVIFIGHSIGGAIATLSSFYYIKKYQFKAENILITYGQPMVGSETFAKEFTNNMNNQIYRIARPKDIGTLFPFFKGIDFLAKYIRIISMGIDFINFSLGIASGNFIGAIVSSINFIKNFKSFREENSFLFQDRSLEDTVYSHIGGLYMIDDDTNTVYHCDDFYNEKKDHFLCKNHKIESFTTILKDFKLYRNYLTLDQDIMSGCQKRELEYARFMVPSTLDLSFIQISRRLEINTDNNNNYYIKRNRKLDNKENIQEPIRLFEEINFKKNKSEFLFKYESTKTIQNDNLILILNPKNKYFFGEICITQILTLFNNNNEFGNNSCYFIDTSYALGFTINLKEENVDEKELYFYIKGKSPGTLELYDLTKNKTLNISSSIRIPYISDFPSEKSLNFVLPKLKENIYLNFLINNYGINQNITIPSIFEIYKGNKKIKYNNNYFILEKNNAYYFKYYPGEYELIINFIPIYSNNFLEKQFYIGKQENIYINYNIESVSINKSFGLFFDYNGVADIKGDFSNKIKEEQDSNEDHIIYITTKYFNLLKRDNDYKYFSLNIKVESEKISELKIFDINEVIIIDKIDSIHEIKKGKNYMILFNETLKKNFAKFQSYSIVSINNEKNMIKLISINDDIITSKNYIITQLNTIKGIFVKVKEDDIFTIKLISEEVSKYLNEESSSFFSNFANTFIDDKKYSIDFIHCSGEVYSFYNSNSNELKIYEINDASFFDDISNNYLNYSLLPLGENILEEKKTYMILKKSSNAFLYEKYFTDLTLTLNYNILVDSKMYYLFSDFEYSFIYGAKIKKILMKVLNNKNNKAKINFICNNKIIEIKNDIEILNVENCNETFTMSGNNSLVYFYLPLTVKESYDVIKDVDNFELLYIYHFFLVPKKNGFNSINILLDIEHEDYYDSDDPVYLDYYIDYGMIPYSSNIENRQIIFRTKANLVIPNYADLSNDNETYFIYFRFNTSISRLNAKVIYENITYLEDQAYIILKPGINTLKFAKNIDHYLNLTKLNPNKNTKSNSSFTIYKDEVVIKKNILNDTDNILYIEEPTYRENIKLKIENQEEILLRVSPEYFDDFSFISYNKTLNVKQIKNILNIKFNTTKYKSRLEYNFALVEQEENTVIDSILIQKKFAENDLLYKTIVHSAGNEPIETNISLSNNNNNFTYDKNYTLIGYGKDFIGNSLNYFYMEPTTLYITDPDPNKTDIIQVSTNSPTNIPENSDNIIETTGKMTTESTTPKPIVEPTNKIITESTTPKPNSEPTIPKPNVEITVVQENKGTIINVEDNSDKEIIEPKNTLIEKETNKSDLAHFINPIKDDSKKNALIIVFSILGCVIVLGGVIGLAIHFKKKSSANINNAINNTKTDSSAITTINH